MKERSSVQDSLVHQSRHKRSVDRLISLERLSSKKEVLQELDVVLASRKFDQQTQENLKVTKWAGVKLPAEKGIPVGFKSRFKISKDPLADWHN